MKTYIENFLKSIKADDPNFVFSAFLIVFFLDSLINYFSPIPVFVVFATIALPVLCATIIVFGKRHIFFVVFVTLFLTATIIGNLIYTFDKKNVSDLLFIFLFVTSYFFYSQNKKLLSFKTVNFFFLVVTFMISLSFIGIDSKSFIRPKTNIHKTKTLDNNSSGVRNKNNDNRKAISIDKKIFDNGQPKILYDKNLTKRIDERSRFRNGLFRVPHIAAYFTGFLFLFFGYFYLKHKKIFHLIAATICLILLLDSGIRTVVFSILISLLIYLINKRTVKWFVGFITLSIISVIFRNEIYHFVGDSFVKPYVGLVITFFDRFDSQWRVLLCRSFLLEVNEFSWYNFIIGKTFINSHIANFENLRFRDWFHNDFLSVAFSYGFICLLAYISLWVLIYKDFSQIIRRNIFIFIFYFSSLFAAFVNGFYYYFPVFLLFLLLSMINEEIQYPVKL